MTTGDTLTLDPLPTRGVTAGRCAALLGVTDQTIRNWRDRGLPSTGKDERGYDLFDPDAARDWVRKFVGGANGGRRPGAGRKPNWKSGRAGRRARGAGVSLGELQEVEQVQKRVQDAELLAKRNRALAGAGTFQELLELMTMDPAEGGFTQADAARVKTVMEAAKLKQQLDLESGKLVEQATVEAEWAAFIERLRVGLDGLVNKAAGRVLAACKLDAATLGPARGAIAAAIEELKTSLLTEGKTDGIAA